MNQTHQKKMLLKRMQSQFFGFENGNGWSTFGVGEI